MQQYKIKIMDLAESDLENAGDYIANQLLNPEAAKNMVQGIRKQINKLEFFPERNELNDAAALKRIGIRTTRYRNYKIYYIVNNEDLVVYIIRIFHVLEDNRMWLYRMFEL